MDKCYEHYDQTNNSLDMKSHFVFDWGTKFRHFELFDQEVMHMISHGYFYLIYCLCEFFLSQATTLAIWSRSQFVRKKYKKLLQPRFESALADSVETVYPWNTRSHRGTAQ